MVFFSKRATSSDFDAGEAHCESERRVILMPGRFHSSAAAPAFALACLAAGCSSTTDLAQRPDRRQMPGERQQRAVGIRGHRRTGFADDHDGARLHLVDQDRSELGVDHRRSGRTGRSVGSLHRRAEPGAAARAAPLAVGIAERHGEPGGGAVPVHAEPAGRRDRRRRRPADVRRRDPDRLRLDRGRPATAGLRCRREPSGNASGTVRLSVSPNTGADPCRTCERCRSELHRHARHPAGAAARAESARLRRLPRHAGAHAGASAGAATGAATASAAAATAAAAAVGKKVNFDGRLSNVVRPVPKCHVHGGRHSSVETDASTDFKKSDCGDRARRR